MEFNRNPSSPFGYRQLAAPGPSRAQGYDREIRDPRSFDQPHSPERNRHPDQSPYYSKPPDYSPSPRESHGEYWGGRESSWSYAHTPEIGYSRRPSPPPPPPISAPASYSGSWGHRQFSPQILPTQISPPPLPPPHWEERRSWDDSVRSDTRHFEPSASWRHSRGDSSNSRIHSLLNPLPHSPTGGDRSWRAAQEQNATSSNGRDHDTYRPSANDYHGRGHEYRQPSYHGERAPYPESDTYRPSYYDDRPLPRVASTYRPPQPRQARPSALGDYKRQRPPPPSHHQPARTYIEDRGRSIVGGRDRNISSTGSRDDSGSSPYITGGEREREHTSQRHPSTSRVEDGYKRSPDRERLREVPLSREESDSDIASSGNEDSEIASSRSSSSSRSSDYSVRQPAPLNTVERAADEKASQGQGQDVNKAGREKSGVMSVHQLISPSPERSYLSGKVDGRPIVPALLMKDSLEADLREKHNLSPPEFAGRQPAVPPLVLGSKAASPPRTMGPEATRNALAQRILASMPPRTPTPAFTTTPLTSVSRELSAAIDTEISDLVSLTTQADKVDGKEAKVLESEAPSTVAKEDVIVEATKVKDTVAVRRVESPRKAPVPTPPNPDMKAVARTLRKAVVARQQFSQQTREQRVNPILIANLTTAASHPGPHGKRPAATSPENLIKEVVSRVLSDNEKEDEERMNTRAALATNFAEQRELWSEKIQRLRDEYTTLHEKWLAHCAVLDVSAKAIVMEDSNSSLPGRTTRRSTATLGDAVRSDLEMEQILATLGNEDLTDPNHLAVRNIANIPDMICMERGEVNYVFDDTNGVVDDPATYYDARSGFEDWTSDEERIFLAKYADYPKQFGAIAACLPNKSQAQCVLYYYVHKKRLIDFRIAVANAGGIGKRGRKGVRKGGKQKGNALLADIQQTDSQKPQVPRRRRGRPPANPEAKAAAAAAKVAAAAAAALSASAEGATGDEPVVEGGRPRRRKTLNSAIAANKLILANEMEIGADGASPQDTTDTLREASVAPAPKKRRGRKPKQPPLDTVTAEFQETKFVDESHKQRKAGSSSSQWSDADKEEFIRLLSRYGKNFKRIAGLMTNKTTVQVSNFYKSHLHDLDLDKIAFVAQSRSPSPGQASGEIFVNNHTFAVSQSAGLSAMSTPSEERELSLDASSSRHLVDAAQSGVRVLSLQDPATEAFSGAGPASMQSVLSLRALNQKGYMSVLHPASFQSVGDKGNPRGMIISAHGQPHPQFGYSVGQPSGGPIAFEYPSRSGEQIQGPSQQQQIQPEVQNATDWPAAPPFPPPARYSSFRAQIPPPPRSVSGSGIGVDKRTPVAIQPAPSGHPQPPPPFHRPDIGPFYHPFAPFPAGGFVHNTAGSTPFFNAGEHATGHGAPGSSHRHPNRSLGLEGGSDYLPPAPVDTSFRHSQPRSNGHQQ